MRAVTRAAGVSVSAANYHFGSKEALMLATLGQVVLPVNRARVERLDELESAAVDGAPALEAVLEAFLAPAVERRDTSSKGDGFRQLAARLYSDPPDIVVAFKQENFGPLSERFIAAIQRVLPDRDPVELALSFQYIVGMMVHVIAGQLELSEEPARDEDARPDDQGLLASLIRFAAAGLRSSPASAPRKTE
jgi:AcrR family transcriptional regulator